MAAKSRKRGHDDRPCPSILARGAYPQPRGVWLGLADFVDLHLGVARIEA
jgi:hypothetical protein